MKKRYQLLLVVLSSFLITNLVSAQEQTTSLRDRLAQKQLDQTKKGVSVPKMSARAAMMNQEQDIDMSKVTWMREVYRFLDLNKEANAALSYPVRPVGDRMSLYTMLFKLLADNYLTAYNFIDNQEVFGEEYKLTFADMADRIEFPYQKATNGTFTYEDYDIPGNEVKGYYIKEVWYFDQGNSIVGTRVTAICPILFRQQFDEFMTADMSPSERIPQFWIPYEDIRPYAARIPILTSDLNNVLSKTIDDYFRFRLYDGEIYKVTNMANKLLAEQYKTPEALKQAQDKIEWELGQFEKDLWVINDSINNQTQADVKASKRNNKANVTKAKSSKPKEYKAPKSASGPSSPKFSARDRR